MMKPIDEMSPKEKEFVTKCITALDWTVPQFYDLQSQMYDDIEERIPQALEDGDEHAKAIIEFLIGTEEHDDPTIYFKAVKLYQFWIEKYP